MACSATVPHLDKYTPGDAGQWTVAKLALISRDALHAGVVVLAGEVLVHVKAFLPLGATLHHVEFAKFELAQMRLYHHVVVNIVRVLTLVTLR